MARKDYLFTSESVSEGHPDKVCDRISDEVVDLFFREGPKYGYAPKDLRVAAETLATTNYIVIAGETRGPEEITPALIEHVARLAVRDIGYAQAGFHWKKAKVDIRLHAQSPHIAQGVDAVGNKDEGAGDQGIMFARKSGQEPLLGPDAKSQVTLRYVDGKPVEVTQIVVSTQHLDENQTSADIRAIVEPYVREALPAGWLNA